LLCPIDSYCEARRLGFEQELPVLSKRAAPVRVEKDVLIVEKRGRLLLWRRAEDSRRLAGFWELPETGQLKGARGLERIGEFRHTIVNTNFHISVFRATIRRAPIGFYWIDTKCLLDTPLSTTAKKALACLKLQVEKPTRS